MENPSSKSESDRLEIYHSKQNNEFVDEAFLKSCYQNYGEEFVLKFLSTYSHEKNIPLLVKKDLRVCYYIYCFQQDQEDRSVFNKVSEKFIDNILNTETELEFKIELLHELVKLGLDDQQGESRTSVLIHILKLLKNKSNPKSKFKNVLLEKLHDRDIEGNYPFSYFVIKAQANTVDKVFVKELIRISDESGYDFLLPDGSSILFHLWRQKREAYFSIFLEILSKEKIQELSENPKFDGMSLMEYYESPQNDAFVFDSYLRYIYDQLGEEDFIWTFSCAFDWDEHLARRYLRNLRMCHKVRVIFSDKKPFEKYVENLCNNVVQFECDSGQQSGFMAEVFKFGFTEDEEVARYILDHVNDGVQEIWENDDEYEYGNVEILQNAKFLEKQDFYKYLIGILQDFKSRFVTKDGLSILYYFWSIDNSIAFKMFLDILPEDKIEELTAAEQFGGKSLPERIRSQTEFNSVINVFLLYVAETYEEDKLISILYPYGGEQNISNCIKRDFKLILSFTEAKAEKGDKLKKIVEVFVENLISLDRNQTENLRPFHDIPKDVTKEKLGVVLRPFFDHLKSEKNLAQKDQNLLQKFFLERDEQGNLPIHVFACDGKTHLISIFEDYLTTEEIFNSMKEKNRNKENFFHIYGRNFNEETGFCPILEAFLTTVDQKNFLNVLKEQDCDGRAPFHSQHGYCFLPYISDHDERTSFCEIQDNDKNNIFHHFAANQLIRKSFGTILSSFLKSLQTDDIKKILESKNRRDQTPLDISESENEAEPSKNECDLIKVFEIFKEFL